MGSATIALDELSQIVSQAPSPFHVRRVLSQSAQPWKYSYQDSSIEPRMSEAIDYLLDKGILHSQTGIIVFTEQGRQLFETRAAWRAIPNDLLVHLDFDQLRQVQEKLWQDLSFSVTYSTEKHPLRDNAKESAIRAANAYITSALAPNFRIPSHMLNRAHVQVSLKVGSGLTLSDVLLEDLPTPPLKVTASTRVPATFSYSLLDANPAIISGYRVNVLDRIDYVSPNMLLHQEEDRVLPKLYAAVKRISKRSS